MWYNATCTLCFRKASKERGELGQQLLERISKIKFTQNTGTLKGLKGQLPADLSRGRPA